MTTEKHGYIEGGVHVTVKANSSNVRCFKENRRLKKTVKRILAENCRLTADLVSLVVDSSSTRMKKQERNTVAMVAGWPLFIDWLLCARR